MKKLFLSIFVICSLLSGNAYAEKVFLKCELTSGFDNWKDKSENVVYRKGELPDVGLEINTKTKKIFDTAYSNFPAKINDWDDNRVRWSQPLNLFPYNSYTLDRLTGKLFNLKNNHDDHPMLGQLRNYKCSAAKKLF
jgi:hypothetical protein